MMRRRRGAEQVHGLILFCRVFLDLAITPEEAAAILATSMGSARELPEIVRKLRVLH